MDKDVVAKFKFISTPALEQNSTSTWQAEQLPELALHISTEESIEVLVQAECVRWQLGFNMLLAMVLGIIFVRSKCVRCL